MLRTALGMTRRYRGSRHFHTATTPVPRTATTSVVTISKSALMEPENLRKSVLRFLVCQCSTSVGGPSAPLKRHRAARCADAAIALASAAEAGRGRASIDGPRERESQQALVSDLQHGSESLELGVVLACELRHLGPT